MIYLLYNWKFVLINAFHRFCPSSLHLSWPLVCSLYLWSCFCFVLFCSFGLVFLESTHKWYLMVFVFVWLISPSIIPFWKGKWQPTSVFLPGKSHGWRSLAGCSPGGRKESDTTEWLHFHFHFHVLEKEMATHSSVLAWRIPGTEETGGQPSMGSHRVGHDWSDLAVAVRVGNETAC